VAAYLQPLLRAGVDELVLGCTHYPFLLPIIQEVAGPGVEIIDPAPAVARQTGRVLAQHHREADGSAGPEHRFFTTGDPARFAVALRHLLGIEAEVRRAIWQESHLLLVTH
jgi:glutamate racemase